MPMTKKKGRATIINVDSMLKLDALDSSNDN